MLRTNGPQQGKSLSSRELEVVNKMLKICKVLLPAFFLPILFIIGFTGHRMYGSRFGHFM